MTKVRNLSNGGPSLKKGKDHVAITIQLCARPSKR